MILTEQQINYIDKNLELYGLKNQTLKEDILDHICTYIENTDETNFDIAYQNAINQFGGYLNINQTQKKRGKPRLLFRYLKLNYSSPKRSLTNVSMAAAASAA